MNSLFREETFFKWRKLFECAWDEETAYPNSGGAKGRPEGQCYVTSRVLKDVFAVFGGRVVIGKVKTGEDSWFKNHCWLELEIDGVKLILDMTADQRGLEKTPIVWGMYTDDPNHTGGKKCTVCSEYTAEKEVEDYEAEYQSSSHAFQRYLLLKKKLGELAR